MEPKIHICDERYIQCQGSWTIPYLSSLDQSLLSIHWPGNEDLIWDSGAIEAMDTGGALLLHRTLHALRSQGKRVEITGLRPEFEEVIGLVSRHWDDIRSPSPIPEKRKYGFQRFLRSLREPISRGLEFGGEATIHFLRSCRHPSSIRWKALVQRLELDGFHALPITGLLAFLMGIVIAYQGAEQLRQFGANIYVVDLVGISIFREIAPLIVAILIAGRSGSAYAAQIGTMKVTEELDAVRTLGLSPMQLLVIPRVVALIIALPLLTLYADILGVLGGAFIASNQLNVSGIEFLHRFEEAVALRHFFIGVGKAPWFAIIIAMVGCYQGFRIRGNVDDVGRRTTIGVVQSIFLVIVFDSFCSIVFSWWSI